MNFTTSEMIGVIAFILIIIVSLAYAILLALEELKNDRNEEGCEIAKRIPKDIR